MAALAELYDKEHIQVAPRHVEHHARRSAPRELASQELRDLNAAVTLIAVCGRYVRRSHKQNLAKVFHAAVGNLSDLNFAPDDEILPTTTQPIIRLDRGDWRSGACWRTMR